MAPIWKGKSLNNVLILVAFLLASFFVLWVYQPSFIYDNARVDDSGSPQNNATPGIAPVNEKPMVNSSLPEWKQELLRDFAFSIISSKTFHPRLQWPMKSWWTRDIDSIVTVLSDTSESTFREGEVLTEIPNVLNTSCPNTYNYGLWCKNKWMLREWRDNPKYKHVKWFYRGMDDSWLHLENVVWLMRSYDYREPLVIGEIVCNPDPYPDGGPGFFISRGLIDHPLVVESWEQALKQNGPNTIFDDVIWGIYLKINNATLVHYHGITHGTLNRNSEVYNYYIKQKDKRWPLNYRPVAYHQQQHDVEFMPEVTRQLHQINYGRLSNDLYTPPDCKCHNPAHRRCWWPESPGDMCYWSSPHLYCLGPGPWPQLDGLQMRTPRR